jgi:uncharacterized protein
MMSEEYYWFDLDDEAFVFEKDSLTISVLSHDLATSLRTYLNAMGKRIEPSHQYLDMDIQSLLRELCAGGEDTISIENWREPDYLEINLMVSNDCNLHCTYCFAREVFTRRYSGKMCTDIAKQAIDLYLPTGKLTSVIFMGGEPTLVQDLVREIVRYTTTNCQSLGVKVPFFPLVTNATLLDSAFLTFASENKMELIFSYDGTRESHNVNRAFANGTGTADIVLNNIHLLREAGIPLHVDATYTRQHMEMGLSVFDVYKALAELGAEDIYVMPVVHRDKTIGFSNEDADKLFNLFKDAAEGSIADRGKAPVRLSYSRSVLSTFRDKAFRPRMCDAGINSFTIMPSGEIFPCYFLSRPDMSLGHVGNGHPRVSTMIEQGTAMFHGNSKSYFDPCRNCWAQNLCFGCFGPTMQELDEVSAPPEYFCSVLRGLTVGSIIALIRDWKIRHATLDPTEHMMH